MGFWRTKQLTFIMTNRCNLACTYCYPGDYKYGNLSIDLRFAERGIQDFLVEGRLGPLDKIRYFGVGEPTLEFGKMQAIHRYALESVRNSMTLRSEIQTNGAFSEDVAHWLGENLSVVCISCDGPPRLQDSQRPYLDGKPTSGSIERNVTILNQYPVDIGIRPTITARSMSMDAMRDIVDYACDCGFHYIYLHPMIPRQGPTTRQAHSDPYEVDVLRFAELYVDVYSYAQSRKIFIGNHLTINFDEDVDCYCRSCLPSPQLMLDGHVSCCDEALYGAPENGGDRFKDLVIGKYHHDRDAIELFQDRIDRIRQKRNVRNMVDCSTCEVASRCGGGCLGEALFSKGDPFLRLSDSYCEAVKYLHRNLPKPQGIYAYTHP